MNSKNLGAWITNAKALLGVKMISSSTKEQHIQSLRIEIETNITELIQTCMSGDLERSRLIAACLRGSRHKLNQLLRSNPNEVTQIDRKVESYKFNSFGSSVVAYGLVLSLIGSFIAVAVWFYSLRYSM